MKIEARACARAGLLGNPSDGYFGKTISVAIQNFHAQVDLEPSSELRIEPGPNDSNVFESLRHLEERVDLFGYYGGDRLVKAAVKRFCGLCRERDIPLPDRNFAVSYATSIPRQIGLAGSSAIVMATLRGLMRFYAVDIPPADLAQLTLDAEVTELGINAGLQDRVIQAYEGCVYMDFDADQMQKIGKGRYEPLDPQLLPEIYLAYRTDLGKISGQVLNTIRQRYDAGDLEVIDTLKQIAGLAEAGRRAIVRGRTADLIGLMNDNFDLRCRIMEISHDNVAMVRAARGVGASAKFAGSGGSIIGIYDGDRMFNALVVELGRIGAKVIKPQIA